MGASRINCEGEASIFIRRNRAAIYLARSAIFSEIAGKEFQILQGH
jgi:hypothetical protein